MYNIFALSIKLRLLTFRIKIRMLRFLWHVFVTSTIIITPKNHDCISPGSQGLKYADRIPCRVLKNPQKGVVKDMTLNCIRWLDTNSGALWNTVLLLLFPAPLWPNVLVPVTVTSMGKIDLFKIICSHYGCVQKSHLKKQSYKTSISPKSKQWFPKI